MGWGGVVAGDAGWGIGDYKRVTPPKSFPGSVLTFLLRGFNGPTSFRDLGEVGGGGGHG